MAIVAHHTAARSAGALMLPNARRGQSTYPACGVLNNHDTRGTIVSKWDRYPTCMPGRKQHQVGLL